jgi:hypothetical protein
MRVMEPAGGAERVQGGSALDRLGGDQAGSDDQRRAFVPLVRDRVVGGGEPRSLDAFGRDSPSLRRIAQLAHQVDVFGRVHELQLLDRCAAGRQQVAVLDQTGRGDQIHSELDANRLQRMLIGEVMFHQLVAVDERNRAWHVHLR